MSDVVQFKKTARRRWAQGAPKPLVLEIMDALHDLGGQAHRDMVFDYIAANRANTGVRPPFDLYEDLLAAFEDHIDPAVSGPRLLALPFGPESRRWALTHEAAARLKHRTRSARLI